MSSGPRQSPARLRSAQQQSEWLAREQRRRTLIIGGWVAAGVLFVLMIVYLVWQEAQPKVLPGEIIPLMAAGHIAEGKPHDPYNSEPPTSGPHYASPVEAGFYEEAVADEYLVHNEEHGHIIIWYNCSNLSEADCTTLKNNIRDTMSKAGVSSITGTLKLVAVPRPSLTTQIALTSWGHLQRLERFDSAAIIAFIKAYRDQAPEPGAA